MRRLLGIFLWSVTGVAFAGEYAVFASGSRLHVDRHETSGGKVRLYNAGGYIEMDRGGRAGLRGGGIRAAGARASHPRPGSGRTAG